MLRGRSFGAADKIDAMVEQERRLHEKAFDALLERYAAQGTRLERHLVKGQLMAAVMDLTAGGQIDLLAMGAGAGVGTGAGGWLLGSSAEQVLKAVPCAVFAGKRSRAKAG